MPLGWLAGVVLSAAALVGCSPTRLPYALDARSARDYTAPRRVTSSADVELEPRAVLLIPTNTTVVRPNFVQMLSLTENRNHEKYVGPARVFLPPGKRSYLVRIRMPEEVVELGLEAEFKSGKHYELRVVDDAERIAFELFELHPTSYAAVYPGEAE